MPSPDQERWLRVKEKLRAEVGEDIFQSWFARMELERIDADRARGLTVTEDGVTVVAKAEDLERFTPRGG